MTRNRFLNIYRELIDENPLAVRAVLKVLEVQFDADVETLAVTCEARPQLRVNLAFVTTHCRSDAHVKAVICHEFLHVLLSHTDRLAPVDEAEHIAMDAVINSIIHRSLGTDYSDMMTRYYRHETGIRRLLRPPQDTELAPLWARRRFMEHQVLEVWRDLYSVGRILADDIRDLARQLQQSRQKKRPSPTDGPSVAERGDPVCLGSHGPDKPGAVARPTSPATAPVDQSEAEAVLATAVKRSLAEMSGSGVFREQRARGVGLQVGSYVSPPKANESLERWRQQTLRVLRAHLRPDPRAAAPEWSAVTASQPILSPGDRRAALRAQWSPFLPESRWQVAHRVPKGSAQVYLDVSGSMAAEMPSIIQLLGSVLPWIRRPFWAFSDDVAPARIVKGVLETRSSGGTDLDAVLAHIAATKPSAAVIVTDGYVGEVNRRRVTACGTTKLHVVVSREGSTASLRRAGLSYTQLGRYPR